MFLPCVINTISLLPCPLLAALGLFRATLLLLLLRLLEHGEIAFHALAFFGTPALRHLWPQQMLDVLGGDGEWCTDAPCARGEKGRTRNILFGMRKET